MRISDWGSDVCASDLPARAKPCIVAAPSAEEMAEPLAEPCGRRAARLRVVGADLEHAPAGPGPPLLPHGEAAPVDRKRVVYGKGVSVSVDLGGRRTIEKYNNKSTAIYTLNLNY